MCLSLCGWPIDPSQFNERTVFTTLFCEATFVTKHMSLRWKDQVRALHSVLLVSLVILVLYSFIFITWSQLLQLYSTLVINKNTFFLFSPCKTTFHLLHLHNV